MKALMLTLLTITFACRHAHGEPIHDDHEHDDHAHEHGEASLDTAGSLHFDAHMQRRAGVELSVAEYGVLRRSLTTYGTIQAPTTHQVVVSAPFSGSVRAGDGGFPFVSQRLSKGQTLMQLQLSPSGDEAPRALELAVERAELALRFARRERDRVAELVAKGSLPERERAAARQDWELARNDLSAARARLQRVPISCPLDGVLDEVLVTPGAWVAHGQPLARITDPDHLWLVARIPEVDVAAAPLVAGAWFEVTGFDQPFELDAEGGDRLLSTGARLDPGSHTLPMTFSLRNPEGALRPGLHATVHLLLGDPLEALAIPTGAVLEDGDERVVYVQVSPDRFARRGVAIGARDGAWVEVLHGLEAGEIVVSRGAWSLKLSEATTALPAHGHAH